MLKDIFKSFMAVFALSLIVWAVVFSVGEAHIYNNWEFMKWELLTFAILWVCAFMNQQWYKSSFANKRNRYVVRHKNY